MSKETEANAEGALVVGADGTTSWWLPRAAAVAEVRVPVAVGVEFSVDAGDPTLVLGWSAAADADLAMLSEVFGDAGLVDRIRALRDGDRRIVVEKPPALTRPWVRFATVAAVRQRAVRPLHEGALLLDLAAAASGIGNGEAAAHVFGLAAPSLLALGEGCLVGDIRGGAATELVDIAQAAATALAGTAWAQDVHALATRLQEEVSEVPDVFIDDLVGAFSADIWVADVSTPSSVLNPEFVDPALVPARILSWAGAGKPEVFVEMHAGYVIVTATLAQRVDDRTLEANQLLAYAARREDGGLVATVPMTVAGRTVKAALAVGDDLDHLSFGIFHADSDLDDVRADPTGRLMVEVDREMADAFAYQRGALAVLHRTSIGDDQSAALEAREGAVNEALAASGRALSLVMEGLDRGIDDEDTREHFESRVEAIEAFETNLERGEIPSGAEPLLAELLPTGAIE